MKGKKVIRLDGPGVFDYIPSERVKKERERRMAEQERRQNNKKEDK